MRSGIRVCLFFTFGMNLCRWDEAGILDREVCLYEKLIEHGVEVAFFTYGDQSEFDYADRLAGIRIIPAWSKWPSPKGKAAKLAASLTVPWIWRRELGHYHLLKTNQMWGAWVPLLARRLIGKPVLLRCGYEAYRHALEEKVPWFTRHMIRWLAKWAYASCDKVALSYQGAADFATKVFGLRQTKVVIQPNYVDTHAFRPIPSDVHYPRRVLFVGRLDKQKQKNLSSLIQAIARSGLGLDIVGQGRLEILLESEARALGADVRFLGVVSNIKLPKIMARYPVFVLPSLYEGNPKVLLEAMSCGMAVIGTDVHGTKDIIRNGVTGLLCGTSSESLAGCIEKLVHNKDLRRSVGIAAREYILEHFSLDRIVLKEMEIYQRVIKEAN